MLSRIIKEVVKKKDILLSYDKAQIVIKQNGKTIVEKWFSNPEIRRLVDECGGEEVLGGKLWQLCNEIISVYDSQKIILFYPAKVYLCGYGISTGTFDFDIPYKKIPKFVDECRTLRRKLQ